MKNLIFSTILCASDSLYALNANAATTYKYDAKGNLIEEKEVQPWNTYKYEYTYDSNGNQASKLYYSSADAIVNNAPSSKYEYIYDEHGNQTGFKNYYSVADIEANTPNRQASWENTYDANGNLIEGKELGCGGGCFNTITYEYDEYAIL